MTIIELETRYEMLAAKAAKAHRDSSPEAARELTKQVCECINEIRCLRMLPVQGAR